MLCRVKMEMVAKKSRAKFVINISELGEGDPLMQNVRRLMIIKTKELVSSQNFNIIFNFFCVNALVLFYTQMTFKQCKVPFFFLFFFGLTNNLNIFSVVGED